METLDALKIIDSDTHVYETEDTWEFLAPDEQALRPTTEYPRNPDPNRRPTRYWNFAGHRRPRVMSGDVPDGTVTAASELHDIDVRLRHMDELGVETHVIFPTVFLTEPAEFPENELAWARAYNRWLADRCAKSHGRLRWVCIPPLRNMEAALDEVRFAKDNGACGVLKKGDQEAGKWPAEPYFFPLYDEAQRLDMPICFHLGSGLPEFSSNAVFACGRFMRTRLPVLHAVHSLITQGVPRKFPNLRFAAIEAGASWIPFLNYDLKRRFERLADFDATDNLFKANNIYVTCQVDEDLPYIIGQIGDENLLVGSDYSHGDASKELDFVSRLRARADCGEITHEAVRKIVYENPKKLYGL
jgi:predicted TIM-barrel fold metal-dependent hydrolase